MALPDIVAAWLHTVAFAIAWGYYGVLGRLIVPALDDAIDASSWSSSLVAIERRALPLLGVAIALIVATGVWLLVVDPRYEGVGNLFASTWTTLMFLKHVAVVAFVVFAILVHRAIRRLDASRIDPDRRVAARSVTRSAELATASGAAIALLTVVAQASA